MTTMTSDDVLHRLPTQLQDIVERELEPDETLLWIAQPHPAFFAGYSLTAFLLAIPWTLFALFWICGAAGFQIPQQIGLGLLFPLFGVPFVLIGIALLCSPLLMRRNLKKTVYAITDRRAIIFAGGFRSTNIVSRTPSQLHKLRRKEKSNGLGDVVFDEYAPTEHERETAQSPGWVPTDTFLNISQAKEVERLLKELAAQSPPETEPQTLEQIDDPPILKSIPAAPRDVPLSVRMYLRLCSGSAPMLGWIFGGFGIAFALFAVWLMGLDDTIPRIWSDAGKVKITNIEDARFSINDSKIYAYHFESANKTTSGVSYGYGGEYKTGDDALLQKSGKRYRVEKLTLTRGGNAILGLWIFIGAGSLFGLIGLCFPIASWRSGGKAIFMLQYGEAVKSRLLGAKPTNVSVNDQRVMKVDFEYQVEGTMYTASIKETDTSRLTDAKSKVVFYDPMQPERSIVWDGLPSAIRLDELTGQFGANPLYYILPLLAATIVCGELAAIIFFAIRAI
ncbi:MAG: hypothetical protein LBI05_03585 [Planctomycetaceae bacterium]|jgi:hypothetical protein|nr:hypothetical protein [Planctomycetaceae bacterium]